MKFAKDNFDYSKTQKIDDISYTSEGVLALLNSGVRDLYKDKKGIYKRKAISCDEEFNVTFQKVYVKIEDRGFYGLITEI